MYNEEYLSDDKKSSIIYNLNKKPDGYKVARAYLRNGFLVPPTHKKSIEFQRIHIDKFAEENKLFIVAYYIDREMSGLLSCNERPAFGKLMGTYEEKLLDDGLYTCDIKGDLNHGESLIVTTQCRLSRDFTTLSNIITNMNQTERKYKKAFNTKNTIERFEKKYLYVLNLGGLIDDNKIIRYNFASVLTCSKNYDKY